MTEKDYTKYIVDSPVCEPGQTAEINRQMTQTYLSNEQVSGCNYHLSNGWLDGMPEPALHIFEHFHNYNEIVIHWGNDHTIPQVLGGEVEFYVGGQPVTFDTTTVYFLPKGTHHGPVTWKKFKFPHVQMALRVGNGDREDDNSNGMKRVRNDVPARQSDIDYEQYVIRNPIRKNDQLLSMVYLNDDLVPGCNVQLEMGWIDKPVLEKPLTTSTMQGDRIFYFMGNDPENPEDLGADIEFSINGMAKKVSTAFSAFVPKGSTWGPVTWQAIRKPHVGMCFTIGQ